MHRLILICLLISGLAAGKAQRRDRNATSLVKPSLSDSLPGIPKDSVNIFINFQDIWGLDLKNGSFTASFTTMMMSNKDEIAELYYLNGEIKNLYTDTSAKPYYEAWNIGEFRTGVNFKDYPLDKQYPKIMIEPDGHYDQTIFYTHEDENIMIGKPHLSGWKVDHILAKSHLHKYTYYSAYKHKDTSGYSQMVFTIVIERSNKWVFLLKLFLPGFISLLILMIGFLVSAENLETRFGLGVASIFGVISSLILIQQDLPALARLTLIEILNYIAILTVFATLVIFAIAYRRYRKGKPNKKFEHIALAALVLFYVVASAGILFLRS